MTFRKPIRDEIVRLGFDRVTMISAWRQSGDNFLSLDCWGATTRLRISSDYTYCNIFLDDRVILDLLETVHGMFVEDPEQALIFVKSLKR